MKKLPVLLIASLVTFSFQGNTVAGMYKWVDEAGVIHFSDMPPQKVGSTTVETLPTSPKAAHTLPSFPSEVQENSRPTKPLSPAAEPRERHEVAATVDLYVTSWCGYCRKAREFLRARGVPFTEYDIEQDADAARRKQEIDPRPGVPLAVINGQVILGFSASTYERALVNR